MHSPWAVSSTVVHGSEATSVAPASIQVTQPRVSRQRWTVNGKTTGAKVSQQFAYHGLT